MMSQAARADGSAKGVVLVIGANGFLGGYVVAALRQRGWRVLLGVRHKGLPLSADERECDLERMRSREDWMATLAEADAVVNVAGILREEKGQTFEAVHYAAPLALARACVAKGVRHFVQISALGLPEDGEFIASKHRFDEALSRLPLRTVVLRPSVVYAASGSYGGTSLLRALAGFPAISPLPGDGRWLIQPVAAGDLAEIAVQAIESDAGGVYEIGGPQAMSLREYQLAWRRWLKVPGLRTVSVPESWVSLLVRCWERIGSGPVGETMWRMLRRGNIAGADAGERLRTSFGVSPRPLAEVLAAHPSQVQDRWQAQLYFLAPALRFCAAVLWLVSAWAGWTTPAPQIEALAEGSLLEAMAPVAVARTAGTLDAILAIGLLAGWRPRMAIAAMMAMAMIYTLAFGLALPGLWLDPLGGLAKNLLVLPALAVLWVLSDRR